MSCQCAGSAKRWPLLHFCTPLLHSQGRRIALPSVALAQRLRLAPRLANLVVMYVLWGSELLDWATTEQRRTARWLIDQGADLIVGHHPHVVQPAQCLGGKPVFYSLGSHVFDQKYPATTEGALADCRVGQGRLRCSLIATRTPAGGAFPRLVPPAPPTAGADGPLGSCAVALGPDFRVAGLVRRPVSDTVGPAGAPARTALAGPGAPPLLLALERHPSPLDQAQDPRPYVYEDSPRGLIPRWRGSALAWPLLDAALAPDGSGVLWALHRGDSLSGAAPRNDAHPGGGLPPERVRLFRPGQSGGYRALRRAYSAETGQPFQRKLDTESAANWTPVPGETGQSERSDAWGGCCLRAAGHLRQGWVALSLVTALVLVLKQKHLLSLRRRRPQPAVWSARRSVVNG
jgi:hypothetical protein